MKKKPSKAVNVLAVGVGGQGIISLADVIAEVAFRAGYDVKKSEIHGLSQRGGSVNGHIRWGEKIHTPVIMDGEAHFMVALEELEAWRWAHLLRPDGLAIINSYRIMPTTVILGKAEYPEDIAARVAEYAAVEMVKGTDMARQLGNVRAANTILLGVLSRHLEFSEGHWTEALTSFFPKKILAVNLQAFAAGRATEVVAVARHEPIAV